MSGCRVFVSYAREDIQLARRVYEALKGAGHTPWMDEVDLLPGQNWKVAIQDAIQNSRFFVALLSKRSVSRKGYAQTELSRALDELDSFPDSQIYLIPARLDDCEVPRARLRELHWVDLFADWEVGIAKILRTIETDMYSAKHGLTPAPLEHLTWLMDFCDSPPYGHFLDPTREFDLPSRASQMFGMRIPPANIADILNGAPVEPMPNDPNLEEWATANTHEQHDSIDGFWSSRWRATGEVWQNGRALFRTVGDWVTIEVQDEVDQYIIRARRDEASRIVGRYMNCVNVFDTSPWVGVIVDDTRIDGFWYTREERYGGSWHQKRWDFRR